MNENVELGRTTKLDSIVRTWLTEAFLKNTQEEDLYYFENNQVNEKEDLIFHAERYSMDNQSIIDLIFVNEKDSKLNKMYQFNLIDAFNQFSIKGLSEGLYQVYVRSKVKKALKKIDQIIVGKYSPESNVGRNMITINRMVSSNNIEVIEMDKILENPVKNPFSDTKMVQKSKNISVIEFPAFWIITLVLLFTEWFFRKKINLI